MVGMKVRQNKEGDAPDTELAQAAVDGARVGPGVHHECRTVPGGQHQAVSLSDIAGDHSPARWRPAGQDAGERCRTAHRQDEGQCAQHAEPGPAQRAAADHQQHHGGGGERQPARPATRPGELRPRQRRSRTRDLGDPLGRPARTPRQPLGERERDGGGGEGREAEDRRGGHGQFGEQVAGHRHQPHPRREDHDHRGADHLGGCCGGDHLGDPGGHPAPLEGGAPPRGEQQQRAGRQDGEQKAVTPGEPGVVEDQQQDGGGQRREQRTPAAGADRQQRDQPAGGGPQHARIRAAHDHEDHGERAADEGGSAQREPQAPCQPAAFGPGRQMWWADQQGEHDRQIAAGDGEQMRQIGGPEGVVEVLRHTRGVAHDEAGQQRPGIRAQSLGGLPEPGTQLPGQPLEGGRRADRARRPVGGDAQHRADLLARRLRRYGTGRHPDTRRRQQTAPRRQRPVGSLRPAPRSRRVRHTGRTAARGRPATRTPVRRAVPRPLLRPLPVTVPRTRSRAFPCIVLPDNGEHRRADGGDRSVRRHDADGIGGEHQGRRRLLRPAHLGPGHPRVAGHLQLHGEPGIPLCPDRQRPAPCLRHVQRRGRRPRGGAQQHRRHGDERPGRPDARRASAVRRPVLAHHGRTFPDLRPPQGAGRECHRHSTGHGHATAGRAEADRGSRPCGQRRCDQPEVGRAVVPPLRHVRRVAAGGHGGSGGVHAVGSPIAGGRHGSTRGRRSASRRSPIPGT